MKRSRARENPRGFESHTKHCEPRPPPGIARMTGTAGKRYANGCDGPHALIDSVSRAAIETTSASTTERNKVQRAVQQDAAPDRYEVVTAFVFPLFPVNKKKKLLNAVIKHPPGLGCKGGINQISRCFPVLHRKNPMVLVIADSISRLHGLRIDRALIVISICDGFHMDF